MNEEYILTFEISEAGDVIDIHCNQAGLEKFSEILSKLNGSADHEHLYTPEWGGSELSELKQSENTSIINKVTIHKW